MKNIFTAIAALGLILPVSCTKDVPVQADIVRQQHMPTEYEFNQVVTLSYSTGSETISDRARFMLIKYQRTAETMLMINTLGNLYSVNILNLSSAGTYPLNSEFSNGSGPTAAVIIAAGGFKLLNYNPGTITIDALENDRIRGSIDARFYSTEDAWWEGVDTVFLTIRGSFDGKLEQIDR